MKITGPNLSNNEIISIITSFPFEKGEYTISFMNKNVQKSKKAPATNGTERIATCEIKGNEVRFKYKKEKSFSINRALKSEKLEELSKYNLLRFDLNTPDQLELLMDHLYAFIKNRHAVYEFKFNSTDISLEISPAYNKDTNKITKSLVVKVEGLIYNTNKQYFDILHSQMEEKIQYTIWEYLKPGQGYQKKAKILDCKDTLEDQRERRITRGILNKTRNFGKVDTKPKPTLIKQITEEERRKLTSDILKYNRDFDKPVKRSKHKGTYNLSDFKKK